MNLVSLQYIHDFVVQKKNAYVHTSNACSIFFLANDFDYYILYNLFVRYHPVKNNWVKFPTNIYVSQSRGVSVFCPNIWANIFSLVLDFIFVYIYKTFGYIFHATQFIRYVLRITLLPKLCNRFCDTLGYIFFNP